jgi:peptide/nickel transport system substrate-binding protein
MDIRNVRGRAIACAALLALAVPLAQAASITIGLPVTPTSMDPHFHQVSANTSPLSHVMEPLVELDPAKGVLPALAVSWRSVGDKVWDFKLRPNVKFHDGSPFTAKDVIFTYKRVVTVPNTPASFGVYVRGIESMIEVDPLTLRIIMKEPDAEFLVGISQILIMSHIAGAGPAPEGKTTQQMNSGNGVIGTGPYKFVSFTPNDRVVLAANPQYWGKRPPWESVTLKVVPNGAARAAALLSGEIDVALIPGENVDTLKANPKVSTIAADTVCFTYLALDQNAKAATVTGTDGRNPLRDPRVRKALSVAINRDAISRSLLPGLSKPAAELGWPTLFGASADARPDPYDPAQAKRLLAEAGYPNGFGITLATTSGLYLKDAEMAQAIASMWTRAGVQTKVDTMASTVFYARRNKLEHSAYLTFFCNYNGQLSYPIRLLSATRDVPKGYGTVNVSGYSNPKLDELIRTAMSTVDDGKRKALVQQASKIVRDETQVLSIVLLRYPYGVRQGLTFRPRADTFVTAMQVDPKK